MSSYRTPWDFSVGGCIVQDTAQLNVLRESYASEARTQAMGREMLARAQQEQRRLEDERDHAVRRATQRAMHKQQAAQQHKQDRAMRQAARTAALQVAIPLPNLLPFSSHAQRMPPPLASARGKTNGAQSARGSTGRGAPHTMMVAEQLAPGASLNMRTQEQAQDLLRHCQATLTQQQQQQLQQQRWQQQLQPVSPQQQSQQSHRRWTGAQTARPHAPVPHPPGAGASVQGSQTARRFIASPPQHSAHPNHAPFHHGGAVEQKQQPHHRQQQQQHQRRRGDSSSNEAAPTFAPASGFPLVPHPFYSRSLRQLSEVDRAFHAQLDTNYPRDTLPRAPLELELQARADEVARGGANNGMSSNRNANDGSSNDSSRHVMHAPLPSVTSAPLPPNYRLNEWSIEWNAHKKKCRETRLQEFLLSKRYL